MKKINKKENPLTTMFANVNPFAEDLSKWNIPMNWYLKDMNEKQLLVVSILELEICDDGHYFVETQYGDMVCRLLSSLVDDVEEPKTPKWIRRIFGDK